jgi:LacI family repressor for deo operon, udp, cdd, tsx, nupC, and nupG
VTPQGQGGEGMGKTTIKDVAGLAGVSASSVSRSLRGKGGVSQATTERIRDAAERLGFTVSPAAYRLATGRTGTVAVVMPYLTRWFFAEVLGGAEEVIRRAGLDLLVYHVGDTENRQKYFSSGILRKRVDGVLLVTLALTEPEICALRALDVPVCMVGAEVEGFSSISVDDEASARTAVQHLINLGHERIALISGDPNEPMHFTVPLRRRAGYRAALEHAGLPAGPELEAHGAFTVEGGAQATFDLLGRPEMPTAIFAECDEMAFGALKVLRQVGLCVPGDVSVVGFDDHPMASYFGLTTVRQEVAQQGRAIAELLVAAAGDGDPARSVRLTAPTRLVVRETTAVRATNSANATSSQLAVGLKRPRQRASLTGGAASPSIDGHDPLPAATKQKKGEI